GRQCRYIGHDTITFGKCSNVPILSYDNVGQQNCGDSCDCYIQQSCKPKGSVCTGPGDYCVGKHAGSCDRGFAKVFDSCFQSSFGISLECDCCKNLACEPIVDQCSGEGQYCIAREGFCATGDTESLECTKPLVENGEVVGSQYCKCCKPPSN
ncbi:unnamed protein product, partial [Meganyctiphanes norvegica]